MQDATLNFDLGAGNTLQGTYNSTTVPSPPPGVFQVAGSSSGDELTVLMAACSA